MTKAEVAKEELVLPGEIREPEVTWEDIAGLAVPKQKLKRWAVLVTNPRLAYAFGCTRVPKGIMLTGPPGCGKTLLAEAFSTESKSYFLYINCATHGSFYVNQSAINVGKTFDHAAKIIKEKGKYSSCVIFFDEFDAIAAQRGSGYGHREDDKVVCAFNNYLDGLDANKRIFVLSATNVPEIIDEALKRPGRFDEIIEVNPPTEQERGEVFSLYMRKARERTIIAGLWDDIDIKLLAKRTEDFTPADIEYIVNQAGMARLWQTVETGQAASIDIAKLRSPPVTTQDLLAIIKTYDTSRGVKSKGPFGFASYRGETHA